MLVSIAMVASFPKHSSFELWILEPPLDMHFHSLVCQMVILNCKPTVGRGDLLDLFGI
jgi:hypothetical protein